MAYGLSVFRVSVACVSCLEAMSMQPVMEFVAYGWMNEWIWCGWIFDFVSLHFDYAGMPLIKSVL
jgi:hypothetical protein